MAQVAYGSVKSEKLSETIRHVVTWRDNRLGREVFGFGLNEIDASVVTFDVNIAVRVRYETASEGGKVSES